MGHTAARVFAECSPTGAAGQTEWTALLPVPLPRRARQPCGEPQLLEWAGRLAAICRASSFGRVDDPSPRPRAGSSKRGGNPLDQQVPPRMNAGKAGQQNPRSYSHQGAARRPSGRTPSTRPVSLQPMHRLPCGKASGFLRPRSCSWRAGKVDSPCRAGYVRKRGPSGRSASPGFGAPSGCRARCLNRAQGSRAGEMSVFAPGWSGTRRPP